MGKLKSTIESIKEKRERLLELKKKAQEKRDNCDTVQFYEDSIKISNFHEGMVIIITKDKIIRERAPKNLSHESIAESIIGDIFDENVNFHDVDGDFGNIIANKYGCVFIRMVSVLNGASMIYYPSSCSDFQISELIKFNDEVKLFNTNKRDNLKACFDYYDKGDVIENNIDNVIAEITKKKKR